MGRRKNVCKVCGSGQNINAQRRCPLCQASMDAVEAGISYGKLISQRERIEPPKPAESITRKFSEMRKCKWCGEWFEATHRGRLYCSERCKESQMNRNETLRRKELGKRGKWEPEERTCVICGKKYIPRTVRQLTCCVVCSNTRRRQVDLESRRLRRAQKKA
nr:MAG TPA: Thaumarchaeal output domain 1 [Caudoviricetes sp.]